MRFDRDDDLNGKDFDRAVWAYRLLQWTRLEGMAKAVLEDGPENEDSEELVPIIGPTSLLM